MNDLISRRSAIDALTHKWDGMVTSVFDVINSLPSAQPERKSCKTCHLWEDGEISVDCPWGSNYDHYEGGYCSLWEKQN